MKPLDIILSLLRKSEDELQAMSREITEKAQLVDKENILNILAVNLINKNLEAIISVTDAVISRGILREFDDTALKIVEYRLLALSFIKDYRRVLETLRLIKNRILYLSVFPYPFLYLNSLNELLDEQKLLFIKRQTVNVSHLRRAPISGIVILSLYRNFDKSVVLSPNEKSELFAYMGVLLSYTSRGDIGRKLIDFALSLKDGYITRVASGVSYYLLNNYRRAFNEFMVAIKRMEKNSRSVEALVNLSQLFLLTGEYSIALNYITNAIKRNPDAFSRFIRGLILLNLERINEAILAFKALLGTKEKEIRIHALLGLAECYLLLKNYKKAFEMVWKAHMLNPSDRIVSLYAEVLKNLS